jgi:hypothetical protein
MTSPGRGIIGFQYRGDRLEARVSFDFALAIVVRAKVIDFDHDDRNTLTLSRGAAPLALEKLLEVLLRMKACRRVDGGMPKQLVLGEDQPVVALFNRRLELLFADGSPARAEEIPCTDEQGGEQGKCIHHGPAVF